MPLLCAPPRPSGEQKRPRFLGLRRPGDRPMTGPMFQTYDPPEPAQASSQRVERLRELMGARGLDALLVPRSDEHQGEYVAPSAERLRWLTGFSGSAGLAVISRKAAALFVDGRYVVQAPQQVDTRIFQVLEIPAAKPSEWLRAQLSAGAVVGFDPWLHTANWVEDHGQGTRAQGHQAQGTVGQPRRPHLGTCPAGAAARTRRPASLEVRRQERRAKARRPAGRSAQGGAGRRHPHAAQLHRLALQYSGLRRRPQSGGVGFCHRAGERQGRALHRSGQDRRRGQSAPGRYRQAERAGGAGKTAGDAETHQQARPPRSQHGGELVLPQAQGRQGQDPLRGSAGARLLVRHQGARPLPVQRLQSARGGWRRLPADSGTDPPVQRSWAARGARDPGRTAARAGSRDGPDRLRQVHDACGDDRRDQPASGRGHIVTVEDPIEYSTATRTVW